MYCDLLNAFRLIKLFHDIGIREKAVGNVKSISEGDSLEIFLRGLEHLAPVYEAESLGDDVCCGAHVVYHFSDPAISEYYRLCRLYEYKHSITPEENPYVKKADTFFTNCYHHTNGDFGAGYNDDTHIRELLFETCPDRPFYEAEFIILVYDVLEFYRREVGTLQNELMRGPMVWLPALPAPKGRNGKPRENARKPIRKAS